MKNELKLKLKLILKVKYHCWVQLDFIQGKQRATFGILGAMAPLAPP